MIPGEDVAMSHRQSVLPFIFAWMLIAVPLAVLLALLFWPHPPPPDITAAPDAIKQLCKIDRSKWRPWTQIVIHHSGMDMGSLEIIDRYHREKKHWEAAGYHFIIGNGTLSGNGEIEVGPRWKSQQDGAHCRGHNDTAIGICIVGNFDLDGRKPSQAQLLNLARLTAYLSLRLQIPPNRIHGHRDMDGASTACPGRNFPQKEFIELYEAVLIDYLRTDAAAYARSAPD